MTRREKGIIFINATLSFAPEDVEAAKQWWEDQRYSAAPIEEILIDAALADVVTPDIESVELG